MKYLSGFLQKYRTCSGQKSELVCGPWGKWGQLGEGGDGGPGPPSDKQDKQLVCNSGGDETPMKKPGGQQDGSDATSRTHHAQSTKYCELVTIILYVYSGNNYVNVVRWLILIICFRE